MSITTRAPYGFEAEYMPIGAFGGVNGFKRNPIANSIDLHGGGAKKWIVPVLGVAAAIAIPFAAPALASAIGLSGAIGATMASAVTGAALGAVAGAATAGLTGENVGRSALFGGVGGAISGGIAGYASGAANQAATGVNFAEASANATGATGATGANTLGATGAGTGIGGSTTPSITQLGSSAPQTFTNAGLNTSASFGAQLSNAGNTAAGAGLGSSMTPTISQITGQVAGGSAAPATFSTTVPTGLGPTNAAAAAGRLATSANPASNAANASFFNKLSAGVSNTGTAIANKFTDPQMLADITLRAAGQLAGSAIAGDGLSSEQQDLVNQQMAELQQLQQTNKEAFNQRLEAAQGLLGDARYFDPEYFGLQRARREQVAGGQAKSAGLRNLTGERRASEARRYDLGTARNVGTAYDQGYLTGTQGRLQTQQAGLSALPMPSQFATNYSNTASMLSENERQRAMSSKAVGDLFGSVIGAGTSKSTG